MMRNLSLKAQLDSMRVQFDKTHFLRVELVRNE